MTPDERAGKLLKVIASLLNYEPRPVDPNYQAAFDEIRAWMYEVEDEMLAKHWHSSVVGLAELRGILEGYEGAAKIIHAKYPCSEEDLLKAIRDRSEEIK